MVSWVSLVAYDHDNIYTSYVESLKVVKKHLKLPEDQSVTITTLLCLWYYTPDLTTSSVNYLESINWQHQWSHYHNCLAITDSPAIINWSFSSNSYAFQGHLQQTLDQGKP